MTEDLPVAVRFSARIRERAIKAEELASIQAREAISNPPTPSIERRRDQGDGRGQYSGTDSNLPTKKQKIIPKRKHKTNKGTKNTKEFEVATEGPGQKDTVDQGMLDGGMTVRDMQNTGGIPIILRFAPLYGQQEELYYPKWRSPSPEPDQSLKQSEELYEDPDGFFWLV